MEEQIVVYPCNGILLNINLKKYSNRRTQTKKEYLVYDYMYIKL